MASPLSVGEIIEIVNGVVDLYNKVQHDVPDQVEEAGEQVKSIASYLKRLKKKLDEREGVGALQREDMDELRAIFKKIETDMSRVREILLKWKEGQKVGGLQLTGFVNKTFFALGSSPKELADLSKKLDRRLDDIGRWIQLLQTGALNTLLIAQTTPQVPPKLSPPPLKSNLNILFVSSDGAGRAKVAGAYARLLEEWTVKAKCQWPVGLIHSAGLYEKARSETIAIQESLNMKMRYCNMTPTQVAQSALFDNPLSSISRIKQPYKQKVRHDISHEHTRGLTKSVFADYHYVICFHRVQLANLENMKDILGSHQNDFKESGKVVLLGAYGESHNSKEILYPRANNDGTESYDNWINTVDRIKVSFRAFLKAELGWSESPPTV